MKTIDIKTLRLYLESDDNAKLSIERIWPEVKWHDLKMLMLKNMINFLLSSQKDGEAVTTVQTEGKIVEIRAKIILNA